MTAWNRSPFRPLAVLCAAVVLFIIAFLPMARAADDTLSWNSLLIRKQKELKRMTVARWTVPARILAERITDLHTSLLEISSDVDRLTWSYYGTQKGPLAMQTVIKGLEDSLQELNGRLVPLEDRLAAYRQDIRLIEETLAGLDAQKNLVDEVNSPKLAARTQEFMTDLGTAKARLEDMEDRLSMELTPALALRTRIQAKQKEFQRGFTERLAPFFFHPAPHLFSLKGWRQGMTDFRKWQQETSLSDLELGGARSEVLIRAAVNGVLTAAVILVVLSVILRRAARRYMGHDVFRTFFLPVSGGRWPEAWPRAYGRTACRFPGFSTVPSPACWPGEWPPWPGGCACGRRLN